MKTGDLNQGISLGARTYEVRRAWLPQSAGGKLEAPVSRRSHTFLVQCAIFPALHGLVVPAVPGTSSPWTARWRIRRRKRYEGPVPIHGGRWRSEERLRTAYRAQSRVPGRMAMARTSDSRPGSFWQQTSSARTSNLAMTSALHWASFFSATSRMPSRPSTRPYIRQRLSRRCV